MKELEKIFERIKPLDTEAMEVCQQHLDSLTKPLGSLGVLEEIAKRIAGITSVPMPKIGKKMTVVMAGDHGVVEEGVNAFPQEVTLQMVLNFLNGGAGINVLSRLNKGEILCVDMGVKSNIEHPELIVKKVGYGTKNMAKGPAMTKEEAIRALKTGIEIAEDCIKNGATLLATGDMGIGNTTPSSAILAAFSGRDIKDIVGRGTGVDDEGLNRKREAIRRALIINNPNPNDPIDVLAKVGGFEIGGLAGLILGAAANKVPVVIDGFISSAAALIAYKLCDKTADYMIASHISEEPGHKWMLDILGLYPMLHLKFRLGEGTGAVMAFNIVEAATRILHEMATFESAGVSKKGDGSQQARPAE